MATVDFPWHFFLWFFFNTVFGSTKNIGWPTKKVFGFFFKFFCLNFVIIEKLLTKIESQPKQLAGQPNWFAVVFGGKP